MKLTTNLVQGYGRFFTGAAEFAVSPYVTVWELWGGEAGQDCGGLGPLLALSVCTMLTVCPVLPVATLLTISLAAVAALLAGLSALVTFPAALIGDAGIAVADALCSANNFSAAGDF